MANFCVAILILNMEENTQHFWHIMLSYFKKSKNATETQKIRFMQYIGKVLWLIKCIKSGLQSSVLEISHWTMLQLGTRVEVDSDQIKLLIVNSQCYTTWEIANISKYPNQ